jgi:hypothetical protein
MSEQDRKFDDHHCSTIEKDRVKMETADCDNNSTSEDERQKCHSKVDEESRKREKACKFS